MTSELQESASVSPHKPPPFVEVWSPDGSVRRFASGTKAAFALERINSKIGDSNMRVAMIESIKAGEQTVEFGPDADLVSYGKGWRLRAVPVFDRNNSKGGLSKRAGYYSNSKDSQCRFPKIDKKHLVIVHRRNNICWDNTNSSSKWSWPTETENGLSYKQTREQVSVGSSFGERNSLLKKKYCPSYTARKSSAGEKS